MTPNRPMIIHFASVLSLHSVLSCSCHLVKCHLMKPKASTPRSPKWEDGWNHPSGGKQHSQVLREVEESIFCLPKVWLAQIIARKKGRKRCVKCDLISYSRDFNRCRLALRWIATIDNADCMKCRGKKHSSSICSAVFRSRHGEMSLS